MKTADEISLSFYRKISCINEKSQVFLVQHIENHRIFIKKTLSVYDKELYLALQKLHIKGTPEIFHVIEDGDNLIVIEEYINGETLNEYLSKHGLLTIQEASDIIIKLCNILNELHNFSPAIIHRDIKPENIMITAASEIFLIDFNASKQFDPEKDRDTILMGTVNYAAPEQFGFRQSDARTDIYALGVLLNVMLTGFTQKQHLYHGETTKIIRKCTNMDPEKRYSSVSQLSKALSRKQPCKASPLPPGFRTKKIWKMIIAVICYALLVDLCTTLEVENVTDPVVITAYRISIFVYFLFVVLISCNYMNLCQKLPLTRSSNLIVKISGIILWCLAGFFVIVIILAIIT